MVSAIRTRFAGRMSMSHAREVPLGAFSPDDSLGGGPVPAMLELVEREQINWQPGTVVAKVRIK